MQQTAFRKFSPTVSGHDAFAGGIVGSLLRAPRALVDGLLALQRQSEERIQLRRLTDHQLRDMGLTRGEAEEMARRVPWTRPV